MADEKKTPPTNVDELKARLGLVKKEAPKTSAAPGAPGVPSIKPPPGVAPPPVLGPKTDARDPFAAPAAPAVSISPLGLPVMQQARPSLVESIRLEQAAGAISVEEQQKIVSRLKKMTALIAAAVGIACVCVGVFWGRAFSSRLIYNRSIEDGQAIYDQLQVSTKLFSDFRFKISTAQQKANVEKVADYPVLADMKALVKGAGCMTSKEGKEMCVLRMQDLVNRSYNIYKPDIVQMLFTYVAYWNELMAMMDEHAVRTNNDKPALDATKDAAIKLAGTEYAVVFAKKPDPAGVETLYANVTVVAAPITDKTSGNLTGLKLQWRGGTPTIDKTLYLSGDLAAAPETWTVPVAPESKEGVIAGQQFNQFISYQSRLGAMVEIMNKIDQAQKVLHVNIGEIASLDKAFSF